MSVVPRCTAPRGARSARSVTVSDFVQAVPPWVRFVLAIVITAGTTMLLVRLFHRRKLALNAKDEAVKGALFIVVQASNPYAGATAVEWPLLG